MMLQLFVWGEGVEGERLGGGGEADQDGRQAVPPRPLGSAPRLVPVSSVVGGTI